MVNLRKPLQRLVHQAFESALLQFPVVVVTGARQTGKTTLVRGWCNADASRRYATLDDLQILATAERAPASLLVDTPMVFDEVQRAPDFLIAVKKAVDERRTPGRFVLTGSANLLLLKQCSESLAGRAAYLRLGPLTQGELRGRPAAQHWTDLLTATDADDAQRRFSDAEPFDWRAAALRGGFPEAALLGDATARARWFDAYIDTYLHRDMRDMARIADLPAFLRFVRLAALRTGGLLNATDLASDCGIPRTTVVRWLGLLEATFLATVLPPFYESKAKRLIKAPKLFSLDTGLALHLAGVHDAATLDRQPQRGAWLENLVLAELLAWKETTTPRPGVYFYRNADGGEIDFVVESGRRLLPIEIKAADAARPDDGREIERFCTEYGERSPFGLVLHTGPSVARLGPKSLALPLAAVI